jgi:hypothetical protein
MYELIKDIFDKLNIKKIIINSTINIGFIATFIGIFYFTYVISVEKTIFNNQVNIITTNIVSSIKPFLSEDNINYIINNLKVPDTTDEDNKILINNNNLKNDAIQKILIVLVVCMIIGYYLCKYYDYEYRKFLEFNLLLVAMVAITEYSFVHLIPSKFITSDPNYVKYKILSGLKNKIEITD